VACTLSSLQPEQQTFLGSYLFARRVSGARVIVASPEKDLCGLKFKNYGCSSDSYTNLPYFTCAAAIGQEKHEVEKFLAKLDEALSEIKS